jgi:hypothetical protein
MQATSGDERHRFVASTVTRIPLGFQFSGIATFASPKPYAVIDGRDLNNDNTTTDDFPNGDRTRMPSNAWKNWYRTVDVRLARSLIERGSQRVSLIVEGFNIFNFDNISAFSSQQFQGNGTAIPTFGQASGAFAARQGQVGLKIEF